MKCLPRSMVFEKFRVVRSFGWPPNRSKWQRVRQIVRLNRRGSANEFHKSSVAAHVPDRSVEYCTVGQIKIHWHVSQFMTSSHIGRQTGYWMCKGPRVSGREIWVCKHTSSSSSSTASPWSGGFQYVLDGVTARAKTGRREEKRLPQCGIKQLCTFFLPLFLLSPAFSISFILFRSRENWIFTPG